MIFIDSETKRLSKSDAKRLFKSNILAHGHSMDWQGVSIVGKESDLDKRLVSESININLRSSPINLRKDTEKLNASYNTVLVKFRRNNIS